MPEEEVGGRMCTDALPRVAHGFQRQEIAVEKGGSWEGCCRRVDQWEANPMVASPTGKLAKKKTAKKGSTENILTEKNRGLA